MSRHSFRPVQARDLPMLNTWLQTPAVRRWWVEADGSPAPPLDEALLDDGSLETRVVSLDGRPFAYIQSYDPQASPGHHFGDLPPGSRGIDQFIGVPVLIGQGHGPAFIRLRCDELVAGGAPAIGTDPRPDNVAAVRAYEKAGFLPVGERRTEWGPALLMVRQGAGPSMGDGR